MRKEEIKEEKQEGRRQKGRINKQAKHTALHSPRLI